ncbi:MAG: ROK family protein [Ardenticatenaceae bacterium]|nr:ROK family protein [Ardenticatenaceae bacterium]
MACYLVCDFGGTKLSAAVMETTAVPHAASNWQSRQRVFSPPGADRAYDIQTMIALGRELLAGRQPTAVGVSFGGPVNHQTGMVYLSHHVPGWESTPLQAILAEAFAAPVFVDNDADIAALGEYHFGAGQGLDSLFYVTVSTGIGGGWILNGRPWRGHQGLAGEIGHTLADPAGPLCLCGKHGCVERLASGPYMAQDLAARGVIGSPITGERVAELAAQGQPDAQEILQRGAWALGVGLGHAANFINPQRFVLGGGVTKSGDDWWRMVRQTAVATALPEFRFDIVPAALGDDAPLWGALALAARLDKS